MFLERLRFAGVVAAGLLLPWVAWAAATPPGYIFVTGWYKDFGVQRAYNQAVVPVLRQHGYERSVLGMPGSNLRVVEGEWAPRMTLLIRFATEAHAKRFWWSDAYQEVKEIRAAVSALDIVQVDGVPGVMPLMNETSAYLVFYAAIADRARFAEEYLPFAPGVVKDFGGQFLVSAARGDAELLEGAYDNVSLVIVEFPTLDALTAFWESDDYRRLSDIRKATGRWSVVEISPRVRD